MLAKVELEYETTTYIDRSKGDLQSDLHGGVSFPSSSV